MFNTVHIRGNMQRHAVSMGKVILFWLLFLQYVPS